MEKFPCFHPIFGAVFRQKGQSMLRKMMILFLAALLPWLLPGQRTAAAETAPLTREELETWAEQTAERMAQEELIPDSAPEDAASEDGYAFQYFSGVLYADRPTWPEEGGINALLVMDPDIPGPRGICVSWEVNRVMEAVPCPNPEMKGTSQSALLYLEGDPENGFLYGLVERDGQRILAMEYGAVDPAAEKRTSLILLIRDDGVDGIRMEGPGERYSREDGEEMFARLEELALHEEYARVPRSLVGTELDIFREEDLSFGDIHFLTATPETLEGGDVEEMLMDNEDGTWLRRIDGDGFEAVFATDALGGNARLISYTLLNPETEGPRHVRLGDLFQEDFTRFRSGEGELDENGMTEILYGTPGTAPYGLADYGNGTEMVLRYVTPTREGRDVELILRYQDTVLEEIMLRLLEEDEKNAD